MLLHFELVSKGVARLYSLKTKAGNTIHFIGQNHAMPMQRGFFVEVVFDVDGDLVTLAPHQGG